MLRCAQHDMTALLLRYCVFTLSSTDALSSTKIIQRVTYRLKEVIPGEFILGTKFLVTDSVAIRKRQDTTNIALEAQSNNALLVELLQNDQTPKP